MASAAAWIRRMSRDNSTDAATNGHIASAAHLQVQAPMAEGESDDESSLRSVATDSAASRGDSAANDGDEVATNGTAKMTKKLSVSSLSNFFGGGSSKSGASGTGGGRKLSTADRSPRRKGGGPSAFLSGLYYNSRRRFSLPVVEHPEVADLQISPRDSEETPSENSEEEAFKNGRGAAAKRHASGDGSTRPPTFISTTLGRRLKLKKRPENGSMPDLVEVLTKTLDGTTPNMFSKLH